MDGEAAGGGRRGIAEGLVETPNPIYWDVLGKAQTLPPNDLSLLPSLSLACYFFIIFPWQGFQLKDIS